MIEELTGLSDFFSSVDDQLVDIYEKWMNKIGISKKILNEHYRKFYGSTEGTISLDI